MRKSLEEIENTTERVYAFLVEYVTNNGYPPTIREIGDGVGLKSTQTVCSHLKRLQTMGLIHTEETKPRAISLVGYRFVKEEAEARCKELNEEE